MIDRYLGMRHAYFFVGSCKGIDRHVDENVYGLEKASH